MLEGKAEHLILKSGQLLADQFAYLRINRKLLIDCFRFTRSNKTRFAEILKSVLDSARHGLVITKSPLSIPSLLLFRLARGELEPGLVSEIAYWRHLHRVWGGRSRLVSDVKTLSKKLLATERLPDLGYYVNGCFYDRNWSAVAVKELVQLMPFEKIFLKRDYSERGRHVIPMDTTKLQEFDARGFGDFVIQRQINQHGFFDVFGATSRSTLRLLTAAGPEGPRVVATLVKVVSSGPDAAIRRVGVDQDSGCLAWGLDENWKVIDFSTGPEAGGLTVPGFDEAKRLVISLHETFPHFQVIGWDVGIDEDETPWLFEWNADHPAILYPQILHGPVLIGSGLNLKEKFRPTR